MIFNLIDMLELENSKENSRKFSGYYYGMLLKG